DPFAGSGAESGMPFIHNTAGCGRFLPSRWATPLQCHSEGIAHEFVFRSCFRAARIAAWFKSIRKPTTGHQSLRASLAATLRPSLLGVGFAPLPLACEESRRLPSFV